MNESLIYKERILELYKDPLNFGSLKNKTNAADEENTLCGDKIKMELKVEKGIIKDIKFSGVGCAISIASASLLTEKVKGKNVAKVKKINDKYIAKMMNINLSTSRIKCATLPLFVLKKAIDSRLK